MDKSPVLIRRIRRCRTCVQRGERGRLRCLMSAPNENVLVIRRELFDKLGAFHGLNFESRKYLDAFLSRGNNFFLRRADAEINPAYKQIIPYALISFENKIAYYVRGKKAGEQRLVAKGSIGIGGHMNETDESLFAMDEQAYRAGVEREVNEEIKINAPFEDRIVALLNDDTTEVGRVHLGIVHVFKVAEPKVEKREAMITGLTFLAKDELLARRETMETWSQICLDSLGRLLQ
jgi:predicted NUDIX family phosphoesterase